MGNAELERLLTDLESDRVERKASLADGEKIRQGGPYGQVSHANFGQAGVTDYRNPYLAEAMRNLGYVQKFGVGILLARKELDLNGNPPLEFDVRDTFVQATIRRRP